MLPQAWSLETYDLVLSVHAHKESVLGLYLSEDGNLLFSSGGDSVVNVSAFFDERQSRADVLGRSGRRGRSNVFTRSTPTTTWVIFSRWFTRPVIRPSIAVRKTPASR